MSGQLSPVFGVTHYK